MKKTERLNQEIDELSKIKKSINEIKRNSDYAISCLQCLILTYSQYQSSHYIQIRKYL